MTAPAPIEIDLNGLASVGLAWRDDGQPILSGPILDLIETCDRAFVHLAEAWDATEERHPPFLAADALHRLDYFRSFPHLATFPVCLDDEEANLAAFADEPLADDGSLRLTTTRPAQEILTPAACYQLYVHHAGEQLDEPLRLTVRNTCFRREHEYRPLQRQWAFQMREIVCVGRRDEVEDFLRRSRTMVDELVRTAGLPVRWAVATDPFFQPTGNARYLLQRIAPTKHELVYDGQLAIGSINLHHDHFGATFDLRRSDEPAYSGCVAFGLERWLYAIVHHFGTDPGAWPDLAAAATAAAASRGIPEEG
jgi:hypothetical protein